VSIGSSHKESPRSLPSLTIVSLSPSPFLFGVLFASNISSAPGVLARAASGLKVMGVVNRIGGEVNRIGGEVNRIGV